MPSGTTSSRRVAVPLIGEMPTMPGFDPGRALARPTGEFVFLRDARIGLVGTTRRGEASAARLLVNRYTVDRVAADLMLGFYFPGAVLDGPRTPQPPDPASRGRRLASRRRADDGPACGGRDAGRDAAA